MKKFQFFCDFDGTITKEDTLNKFLQIYADKKWLEIEEQWIRGEIGSKVCTEEQMKLFPKMDKKEIDGFIDTMQIDETFPSFLSSFKENNIHIYIVSDGFDFFIKSVLERNGVDTSTIKIFSNKLSFEDGRFITDFPYYNTCCERQAGMCKCEIIKSQKIVTNDVLYAGDGLSDFCVSGKVDLLFAKGSLLNYCRDTKNNSFVSFDSFEEIENHIKIYK